MNVSGREFTNYPAQQHLQSHPLPPIIAPHPLFSVHPTSDVRRLNSCNLYSSPISPQSFVWSSSLITSSAVMGGFWKMAPIKHNSLNQAVEIHPAPTISQCPPVPCPRLNELVLKYAVAPQSLAQTRICDLISFSPMFAVEMVAADWHVEIF